MIVKRKIKGAALCCLAFIVMLAMTACGSKEKDAEYITKFQGSLDKLTELNITMTDNIKAYLESFAEADKTALITTIDEVGKAYKELKEIKAPKGFDEIQSLFAEGADKAAPALDIYKKEFDSVTEETFDTDFVARIAEGDKIMEEANQKLIDAGLLIEQKLTADDKKDDDEKDDKKDDGVSSKAEEDSSKVDDSDKDKASSKAE